MLCQVMGTRGSAGRSNSVLKLNSTLVSTCRHMLLMPVQEYCIARYPATIRVRTFTLHLSTPTYFTSYALFYFSFSSTYIYIKHPFYPTYKKCLPLLYCQGFMCNHSLTFLLYNKNCIITLQRYEISHLLAVLIFPL